jgi:hypothetical protein
MPNVFRSAIPGAQIYAAIPPDQTASRAAAVRGASGMERQSDSSEPVHDLRQAVAVSSLEQINLMMPLYFYRHCSDCATWQSMRRFSFLERQSKQKGCPDCHVA